MLQLLKQYEQNRASGQSSVLGTIVKKQGSTYRRPGAKILISESGQFTGLLSGGCFEAEIVKVAQDVFKNDCPRLIEFDMRSHADIIFGLGLGCKGRVWIYVELISAKSSPEQLEDYLGTIDLAKPTASSIVIQATGTCKDFFGCRIGADTSSSDFSRLSPSLRKSIEDFQFECKTKKKSSTRTFTCSGGSLEIYTDVKTPLIRLHIMGAGADVIPVYEIAVRLGWFVMIYDHRPGYLSKNIFPEAQSLIQTRPEELKAICPDLFYTSGVTPQAQNITANFQAPNNSDSLNQRTPSDYIVIMTHNYLIDKEYLRLLLPSPVAYIGLLGPKDRGTQILKELANDGFFPSCEMREKYFNPVGLDLGGDSPETIALAIIAQIQQLKTEAQRKNGSNHLRDRKSSIHDFIPFAEVDHQDATASLGETHV